MRICTTPKIYLTHSPTIRDGAHEFLRDMGLEWPTEALGTSTVPHAQQLIELFGRICYMSFGAKAGSKTNKAYLDNLIGIGKARRLEDIAKDLRAAQLGKGLGVSPLLDELETAIAAHASPAHGSVTENADFGFIATGMGRGFSHEQVRHRAGFAYSQLSTRYCDFERDEAQEGTWDPGFTVPPLGQLSEETCKEFVLGHDQALLQYKRLLFLIERDLRGNAKFMAQLARLPEKEQKRAMRKAARGAARDSLPNGTEAIMGITGNVRAIWNTIYLRSSEHAEGEICIGWTQIAKIMMREMPAIFGGITFKTRWDDLEYAVLPRDKL